MAEPQQSMVVICPQCGRQVSWTTEFPHRPFCNERCKLIDLGEWAMEEKVIPGDPIPMDGSDNDDHFFQ